MLKPAALSAAMCIGTAGAPAALAQAGSETRQAEASEVRAADQHNLGRGSLAIDGYDPVAYFPEGGGRPAKGSKKLELVHQGVAYRFASEHNRERFLANPAKYEPAHGGWCSYAIGQGDKVEIDPKNYVVSDDGRLFLFYKGLFGNAKNQWNNHPEDSETAADRTWRELTGETPRRVSKD